MPHISAVPRRGREWKCVFLLSVVDYSHAWTIIDSSSHPFASILIISIVKNNLILDALSGLQETMPMK